MRRPIPSLKSLIIAVACGVLLSLATGLVENPPDASIIGARHYGYPLVWRITMTTVDNSARFMFSNLAVDAFFWTVMTLVAVLLVTPRSQKWRIKFKSETLLFVLVLFVPLGLIMDLVHEFGHALWGTAVGGRLTYMQIAFFEIYPRFAVSSQFVLGLVRVTGLPTQFAHGLFHLGGSMTTNLVSWLLGLVLVSTRLGFKTQVSPKILGLFGLFDLPFYVVFPLIGLQHWVFLGGSTPEPLIGARQMGIPDHAFYLVMLLTTFGLILLYFKSIREKVLETVKTGLGIDRSNSL